MTFRRRTRLWRHRRLTSAQSSSALPHRTLLGWPAAPLGRSPREGVRKGSVRGFKCYEKVTRHNTEIRGPTPRGATARYVYQFAL